MHVGVLASLLSVPLFGWDLILEIPLPADIAAPTKKLVGSDGSPPSLRLVRAYMSYQDHKGGVVLLEAGQSRLSRKPVVGKFDAKQWHWRNVLSCKWNLQDEHINALEARALLLTLRWRARSAARFSKKFLHLTDSQVALGSFCKQRSNARSFNYIVTRSAALQLAGSMFPVMAYVRSSRNPAVLPSRQLLALRPQGSRAQRRQPGAVDL